MLPPLDVTVFEQNPKFKAFYTEFTASKLHPDGSTKDSKREKEIEDVRKVCIFAWISFLFSSFFFLLLWD